ncbi:MAG: sugar transferase, partial [Patescibacteria group bacterium]
SMYALSDDGSAELNGAQFAKKKDARATPIGKLLRRTRLDELPQILNLLKRDITLIGPRPERPEIVSQLTGRMPYYPLRHIVRPGLTGWAVLHQNYTDTLETSLQKLQYDLYYIKNRSSLLDLSILLRTINVIVRMRGQ